MEEKGIKDVPYIAFESELARLERVIKKLIILLCISLFVFLSSNLAWLYVWNQYGYETVDTQEIQADQDGKGINIVGGEDVNYGSESKDNKATNQTTQEKER